jgi:rhomboid-like protein
MGYIYFQLQNGDINYFPGMLGASGAVYGVLTAFAMFWPNTELFILFIPFPVKAKYAILFMVILELTLGFGNFSGDNIAHFAHLGGALIGFILVKIWNKTNKNSLY